MPTHRTYSEIVQEIKLSLQTDKRHNRLKTAFATLPMFNIDTDDLLDEVMNLNTGRQTRHLNSTSSPDFVDKLIKASLSDQATRSRMAEILSECVRIRRTIETALDSFSEYCIAKYKDKLSDFRTKGEREGVVKLFVASQYEYLNKVITLQSVIQTLLEDIDKSHWTLKTVVEALKLIHVPERRLD